MRNHSKQPAGSLADLYRRIQGLRDPNIGRVETLGERGHRAAPPEVSPASPRMYAFFLCHILCLLFTAECEGKSRRLDCRRQRIKKRSCRVEKPLLAAPGQQQDNIRHTHIQNQRLNYIRNSSFPPRMFLPLTLFYRVSLTNGNQFAATP